MLNSKWKRDSFRSLSDKWQQKRVRQSGENFIIPQTLGVAVCARVLKPSITSTKETEPIQWEIASSLPSRDHAKDKTSSTVVIRRISEPSFRLQITMHFASPGQSVNIIALCPKIEHTVKLQWLSRKRGWRSPFKSYAWLRTPGKTTSAVGWKTTER